jgi:hypothetical protein
MMYLAHLNPNQQLTLENKGSQTLITLTSSSSGQQQSQSSSLETGNWTTPPTLFQNNNNFILRIDTVNGQHFIQLQSNNFNTLTTTPSLMNAEIIPFQKVAPQTTSTQSSISFQPLQPLEPMKPMQLNDMSMNINPMEMRMGNMYLRMPSNSQQESTSTSKQHFCTQCGNLVKIGDRFCANCAHKLED